MKSVTIIGVDLLSLMQTLEMLWYISTPFESNIGNVVVIIVDSQSTVEFTDCRFIGNQGTHYMYYQCMSLTAIIKFQFLTTLQFQEAP